MEVVDDIAENMQMAPFAIFLRTEKELGKYFSAKNLI